MSKNTRLHHAGGGAYTLRFTSSDTIWQPGQKKSWASRESKRAGAHSAGGEKQASWHFQGKHRFIKIISKVWITIIITFLRTVSSLLRISHGNLSEIIWTLFLQSKRSADRNLEIWGERNYWNVLYLLQWSSAHIILYNVTFSLKVCI